MVTILFDIFLGINTIFILKNMVINLLIFVIKKCSIQLTSVKQVRLVVTQLLVMTVRRLLIITILVEAGIVLIVKVFQNLSGLIIDNFL